MRALRAAALSLWILPPIALVACDEPVVPSVTPEVITVNSATSYAVVVAFDRPVSRSSATQSSNYALTRPAGDRLLPSRAALVESHGGIMLPAPNSKASVASSHRRVPGEGTPNFSPERYSRTTRRSIWVARVLSST